MTPIAAPRNFVDWFTVISSRQKPKSRDAEAPCGATWAREQQFVTPHLKGDGAGAAGDAGVVCYMDRVSAKMCVS